MSPSRGPVPSTVPRSVPCEAATCGAPGAPACRRTRPRGFTLLEVLVAGAVASVSLWGLLTLTNTVSSTSQVLRSCLGETRASTDLLASLRGDLGRCRVAAVAADGASITYRVPVPAGEEGAIVDADGEVLWGANDRDGPTLGATITMAFRPGRTVSEATLGRDLNGDGDAVDVFDAGRLVRTSSAGHPMPLPALEVLLVRGDPAGDVDGDGVPDPLFALSEDRKELTLRLVPLPVAGRARSLVQRFVVAGSGGS